MAKTYPALYEVEPIGVDGQLEAVATFLFCSTTCRDHYPRAANATYHEGDEESIGDVVLCETCARKLPTRWPTRTPTGMRVSLTHSILIKDESDLTIFLPEGSTGLVSTARTDVRQIEAARPAIEHHHVVVSFDYAIVSNGKGCTTIEEYELCVSPKSLKIDRIEQQES